jgi:hypothetical protein
MFSRKPRAPDGGEIISPVETFGWQEDDSITERRRRHERRRLVWTICVGATLALLVLGNAVGISWLVTAVASGQTTSAQLR